MSHAAPAHRAAHENHGWNPADPHGDEQHAHGHVVVGWKLQLGVLAALLFFTALTVGFYNFEKWAEVAFDIHLPGWVNIVGAMSIATVKATLVCMFFMQLRYDKALNTFVLLFCLFGVGLFILMTMIDLGSRAAVIDFKDGQIQPGGTGVGLGSPPRSGFFDARASPRIKTGNQPITDFRRQEHIAAYVAAHPGATEKDWWAEHYAHYPQRRSAHDTQDFYAQLGYARDQAGLSDANRSVPRHGLSGALDLAEPTGPGGAHHADGH